MKAFWMGTDSLMLVDVSRRHWKKKLVWKLFRPIIRFLDKFYLDAHYCVSENVADNLRNFGVTKPIKIVRDQELYPHVYPKKEHDGFNIVYYLPKKHTEPKFRDWLYGLDVVSKISSYLGNKYCVEWCLNDIGDSMGYSSINPDIRFIVVDGDADMEEIWSIADFCLRVNRHDGHARMIMECENNSIPYYWSKINPDKYEAIKMIKKHMAK